MALSGDLRQEPSSEAPAAEPSNEAVAEPNSVLLASAGPRRSSAGYKPPPAGNPDSVWALLRNAADCRQTCSRSRDSAAGNHQQERRSKQIAPLGLFPSEGK